jgi:hypothetical protein
MDLTLEQVTKVFEDLFKGSQYDRSITLWTGLGGMDTLNEAFERDFGYDRLYINKAPRFLKLRTSLTGRKYKRIRNGRNSIIELSEGDVSSNNDSVYSSYKS